MAESYQQGVGAMLTINGYTDEFKGFYDKLSPRLGHPAERGNLHLTIVDSAETAIDIFSERDLIALRRTQDEMGDLLSRLWLREVTLHPISGNLKKISGRLVVEVAEEGFIEGLRTSLSEIVLKEMGEGLSGRDYVPHISLLNFFKKSGRPSKSLRAPANLHVNGYLVGQQIFEERPSKNSSQKYVNRTRRTLALAQ